MVALTGQRVRLTPQIQGPIIWSGTAGGVLTFEVKLDRWDGLCPFVTMAYRLDDAEDGEPCTRH